jgi:predicted alpha/beta-fold hydrolase
MIAPEFSPARGLGNPHIQTILSSMGRKLMSAAGRIAPIETTATNHVIEVADVKLRVKLNRYEGAPLIIIVPGWLGSDQSSYVISSATHLHSAGFSVARINLRDHGGTADLNPGMFNSARIDEVVNLVTHLEQEYGQAGAGLLGYSLGGNFALRIAKARRGLPTLAVCPAMDPAKTMHRIDRNPIYQSYFVRKWRKTWIEKQTAFGDLYDFTDALKLSTVSALTDYFVSNHSEFSSTKRYFDAYDLTGDALARVDARILAAKDDPIIPFNQYTNLPPSIELHVTEQGGHGAYLETWQLASWVDRYAIEYFKSEMDITIA